jgi:hypothetical protein
MKKVKQILLVFGVLVVQSSPLQSQIPMVGTESILDKLRLNQGIEGKDNLFYADVQGDPFIFRDFEKGTLYVLPDAKFNIYVRYDIYANQMHLKDSNVIYAIIHPYKVKLIEAGNYKFVYSDYINSPQNDEPAQGSYFIVKTEGKCSLLVKKNIRVQDAEPEKLYQEAKPAKFILTGDSYFIKLDDRSAVKIRNKKDLLNVLEDKSDAISSYISSNKLDVKEVEDLVKIVSYYNTL